MPPQLASIFSSPTVRMCFAALLAFSLDQLSKIVVLHVLDLAVVHTMPVWPPYLNFLMAWNKGVNFGIFSSFDFRWLLVALSIAVSIGLAVWTRDKRGWMLPLAAGTVVGGALGNALDRVIYGAVVDFINMSCCGISNPYAFNVADVLIIFGLVLFMIGQDKEQPSSS
ncbi:signal peptidase II [Massilia glaciei]|uniref:Lipoprotein signal peptidase n=1 Tax=Massilia glaciei TaxID=1524097 RepID=A0A2U2HN53_9BURK|nr:signal peptidase II [Massilia glaciei]PWF48845.1 signal peptidase II [Massilia glaciei]